jgi:flagellar hook-associated protein 2
MPITSTGIATGLDVESLVSSLVNAELGPVEKNIITRKSSFESKITSYGQVKSLLSEFQTVSKSIGTLSDFTALTATNSDDKVLDITTSATAIENDYNISVASLATRQSLSSSSAATTGDVLGTGSLTFRVGKVVGGTFSAKEGTTATTIQIDASNNSIAGIRDSINSADAGVSAAVIYDGTGYRLVITANETGSEDIIDLVVDDDDGVDNNTAGLSQLSFLADDASGQVLTQEQAGLDADLSINGLQIFSTSNQLANVVQGLTLDLKQTGSTSIKVARDLEKAEAAVTDFVSGYNGLVKKLNDLTAYDPDKKEDSVLTGDSTVRGLLSSLRSLMNDQVENVVDGFSSLAGLGITTTVTDGTLSVDAAKLTAALKADPVDVATVFARLGRSSNANLAFESATSVTTSGRYTVNLTGATSGSAVGSAFTETNNQFRFDGNRNLTMTLDVDGAGPQTITFNTDFRNADFGTEVESFRSALQTAINTSFPANQVTVTASGTTNISYTIASNSTGTGSSVSISSAVRAGGESALGFDTASVTAGVNASATIDGAAATVDGSAILGIDGTASEGLRLSILGAATSISGATLDYTIGVGSKLDDLITQLLADDGLLDARIDGLESTIDDLDEQLLSLDRRSESLEKRYRNQFTTLETLISQLTNTQNFLSAALTGFVEPLDFKK